ncbi:LysE family translocator [Crenobacter intestini]|uniref:LysE family translocator n=1 Tax=Crenobacter intestini TaxID=2563443 RepID=A0A4T0ULM7_9NEIS|nr:LysE family translocator [Crenobacter intestini]
MPPLSFFVAAFLLAIIPGPGIAYVVARTASGGKAEGVASTLGTAVGGLVHVLAGALGLSLLIAQSAAAFAVVKYLGAAYLIYLGVRTLMTRQGNADTQGLPRAGIHRAWREGIVVEALNVKTAMFFLAFIPQFVSPQQALAPQFVLLGCICVALNSLADLVAVFAANQILRAGVVKATRQRVMAQCSGFTLVALGVLVVLTGGEK